MNDRKVKNEKKPDRIGTLSPYIPQGVISIDELIDISQRLKEEGAVNVKLSGEIIFVWNQIGLPAGVKERINRATNDFKANSVRPVKLCSAETFCQNFKQPVLSLAEKIDDIYRLAPLPGKFVIGVAGCQRSCSEPATKDIGIIAQPKGYEMYVGGSAGYRPMIGKSIGIFSTQEEIINIIGKILDYFRRYGKYAMRLGKVIEKRSMHEFLTYIGHEKKG